MDIDKVLLTREETDLLWIGYCESNPIEPGWERMKHKAQCLKLLKVLGESCKEHEHIDWDFYPPRYECPECTSELKALLEG